jgi:hypothetical protein
MSEFVKWQNLTAKSENKFDVKRAAKIRMSKSGFCSNAG